MLNIGLAIPEPEPFPTCLVLSGFSLSSPSSKLRSRTPPGLIAADRIKLSSGRAPVPPGKSWLTYSSQALCGRAQQRPFHCRAVNCRSLETPVTSSVNTHARAHQTHTHTRTHTTHVPLRHHHPPTLFCSLLYIFGKAAQLAAQMFSVLFFRCVCPVNEPGVAVTL